MITSSDGTIKNKDSGEAADVAKLAVGATWEDFTTVTIEELDLCGGVGRVFIRNGAPGHVFERKRQVAKHEDSRVEIKKLEFASLDSKLPDSKSMMKMMTKVDCKGSNSSPANRKLDRKSSVSHWCSGCRRCRRLRLRSTKAQVIVTERGLALE
ncbi:hypothetical protein U1Q18_036691 [Sarracenia purpurea var. burkii]